MEALLCTLAFATGLTLGGLYVLATFESRR